MKKVIIGIHGLANKPKKALLKEYWEKSIAEGLEKNFGYTEGFNFDLVYWADLLYKRPLHSDVRYDFDGSFNDEPYYEAIKADLKKYEDGIFDELRAGTLDIAGSVLDTLKSNFGMDGLADRFLSRFLRDLAFYYDKDQQLTTRDDPEQTKLARTVLQQDLKNTLKKHRNKEVLLVAHSMGSIIAYDVLRDIPKLSDPDLKDFTIERLVTIGSPLGLPQVRAKIMQERNYDKKKKLSSKDVRTPSIVTESWVNFADKRDPVALDVHIEDDYSENDRGVRVRDDLISNDYRRPKITNESGFAVARRDKNGKSNYHKSYGYLRAPELSAHLREFLTS
ncbi:MAG: alpha/beta hydrolase [Pseudomonadota bacterium]